MRNYLLCGILLMSMIQLFLLSYKDTQSRYVFGKTKCFQAKFRSCGVDLDYCLDGHKYECAHAVMQEEIIP